MLLLIHANHSIVRGWQLARAFRCYVAMHLLLSPTKHWYARDMAADYINTNNLPPPRSRAMKLWVAAIALTLTVTNVGVAQNSVLTIEISAGKGEQRYEPICIPLSVPKAWAKF